MDIISTEDYSDRELKLIFDFFDKDKDGLLSHSDVERAFSEILPLTSEEELSSIFKVMQPNREERIDFR
ncbi:unnamed protein product [Oikopleura dioica]|uniref:EF-hand domain-containing protein n=1 Tax=Oikopleura dioica TaxID=34765 RepID=E4X071_OIKDI|nr:unnamed protein product [Oikopleura dioica]